MHIFILYINKLNKLNCLFLIPPLINISDDGAVGGRFSVILRGVIKELGLGLGVVSGF
jgi:hypothetical protein